MALLDVLTLCSLAALDFISLTETHPQQNPQLSSFPLPTITKPQILVLLDLEHLPLLSMQGVKHPPLPTALDAGAGTTDLKLPVVLLYCQSLADRGHSSSSSSSPALPYVPIDLTKDLVSYFTGTTKPTRHLVFPVVDTILPL